SKSGATDVGVRALWQLRTGDRERAETLFAIAVEFAEDVGTTTTETMGLAERSILAMARGDWCLAGVLADKASSIVSTTGLEHYATSILVYTSTARTAIHRGDVAEGRRELA